MDQFITLLSNLFNLTKVASVTLPGIALAGALAIFFHPPAPIDMIRIPVVSPTPGLVQPLQEPCSNLAVAVRNGTPMGRCKATQTPAEILQKACTLIPLSLGVFDRESNFDGTALSPSSRPWDGDVGTLAITNLFSESGKQRTTFEGADPQEIQQDMQKAANQIQSKATAGHQHPWEPKIIKQFVLENARDKLTACDDLERAWQGQETADNDQLKTDIANLDKQRSDIQDAYIASLKVNDRVISANFQRELSGILELSNEYRERYRVNLVSLNERTRRLEEIKQGQDNISARLAEPGRLRPIKEFDLYIQGLVNHVVGFVLLSIALSLILVAFDRTVLGNLFESLFPGW